MLAANNGHKDVILTLIQRVANLDLVDAVNVFMCICYIIKAEHHNFDPILVAIKTSFLF